MIPYPIERIDADVIRSILGNTDLSESTARIEYKQAIPTEAESEREPFLGAVCSFANTTGGDVVVGIRAEGGVPVEITGVDADDADVESLKLDSVIRSGMDPQLSAFKVWPVRLDNICVFVVRWPVSRVLRELIWRAMGVRLRLAREEG
jgi:predicted HTH transcriptional regulator